MIPMKIPYYERVGLKILTDRVKMKTILYLFTYFENPPAEMRRVITHPKYGKIEGYVGPHMALIKRNIKTSTSILPKKLEEMENEDGLIVSYHDGGDARKKFYSLTPKGNYLAHMLRIILEDLEKKDVDDMTIKTLLEATRMESD